MSLNKTEKNSNTKAAHFYLIEKKEKELLKNSFYWKGRYRNRDNKNQFANLCLKITNLCVYFTYPL